MKEKNYTLSNLASRHLKQSFHELESSDYPLHFRKSVPLLLYRLGSIDFLVRLQVHCGTYVTNTTSLHHH